MLVIVGHGPSVANRGLGSWLDEQTVVRLKWAERPNAMDWGSRTDYVCGSNPSFWMDKRQQAPATAEYWWLGDLKKFPAHWGPIPDMRRASSDWLDYWLRFRTTKSHKPSTGLRAIFCAIEFLKPAEIGLIGFDMVLHPDVPTHKWWHTKDIERGSYAHDAQAEHRCVMSLDVKITEV